MPAPGAVTALLARETARYERANPASARQAAATAGHWFAGTPLHWMADWRLPFPLCVREARGARLVDVDGHVYSDFCLGDSAAMFGHSPPAVADAIAAQASRGLATMLPSVDAAWVGAELARRFGRNLEQAALAGQPGAAAPPELPADSAQAPSLLALLWARLRRWLGLS